MAVAAFTLSIMLLAFIRGGIEDIIGAEGSKIGPSQDGNYETLARGGEASQGAEVKSDSWTKIRRMISDPLVLSLMLWSFFYVSPHFVMVKRILDLTNRRAQKLVRADTWLVLPVKPIHKAGCKLMARPHS
jgi:hypothetical protein